MRKRLLRRHHCGSARAGRLQLEQQRRRYVLRRQRPASQRVSGSITVLAAASLTETFTTLGKQFETAHPGTKVTFSFGASSDLAQQIVNGSPGRRLRLGQHQDDDHGDRRRRRQRTRRTSRPTCMEVATPPSNPAGVTTLADVAKPSVKVAVCAPAVPCGAAATALFAKNNLTVTPVTQEADVKSVLSKVELDEVDAGIVYVTDVQGGRRQGEGRPDRRQRQRLDDVSDRHAQGQQAAGDGRRRSWRTSSPPTGRPC